jgi:hypothetical protein
MNTPVGWSKEGSDHRKYRDFTEKRMKHILEVYNQTKHSGIDMAPAQMQALPELETKYIIKKIYQEHRRRKITDFELQPTPTHEVWVRYIVPREAMKKRRYRVSPEMYKVHGKAGKAWLLMARDGSTKVMPRWRLLPFDQKPTDVKEGRSFGTTTGVVDKIVGWGRSGKNKGMYKVNWVVPAGDPEETGWISPSMIRAGVPRAQRRQQIQIEKDYWATVPANRRPDV